MMNLPSTLERLEARQLIRAATDLEPTFSFKHNLVQQVAYQSLLAADRRGLHRAVGETLEQLLSDRGHAAAEVLATHFENAGVAEKALHYATAAADEAMRRFATAEAANLFGRALRLARDLQLPEDRLLELYRKQGRALELGGGYATAFALYEEMEALGRSQMSPRLELAGVIGAASLQAVPTPLFDPVQAVANAERALALARSIGDPSSEARAYWLEMLAQTRTNASAAVEAGIASLDLARRHGLREQEAFTLNDIQANYQVLGQPDLALQALEEARPIWIERDNLPMLADNLASTAMLHVILAQYDQATGRSLEALSISERIGNLWGQSYARVASSLGEFARGELGPAIREASRCIEISERAGFIYPQVALRSTLAVAYGLAGDLDTAARLAERVRELERANPSPGQVSGAATMAWIAVRRGDLEAAQGWLEGRGTSTAAVADSMLDSPVALALAIGAYHLARQDYSRALESTDELVSVFTALRWRALRAILLLTRARALKALGRTAEARETLQASYEESVQQGLEAGLWEVESELGAMARAVGDESEAARWMQSAASHVRAIAEGLAEHNLFEPFLSQPQVRAILDAAPPA